MFAKLSALVSGGPAFNYNVDPNEFEQAWGCWHHYPGTSKDDGQPVSVFKIVAADPDDVKLVAARNGVKRLKMLRHPNVLAFKDSLEVQEKGQTVLYLVTEAVKPLKTVLQELNLSGQHRDEYLATGMLHMTNAVSFINNSCNMIHGHLCMAAVVVTDTLDWRLHGFDLLSEHSLPGEFALRQSSWLVPNQYKPAEVAKGDWEAVRQGPAWAVDSWGLGCMMQEVFSGRPLTAVEQLRQTDVIPPALLSDYQKLLSSQTGRRLNPSKVAESKFLNNKLVEVVAFMENIAVKDSAEKDAFFKRLPTMIPAIPEPVAVRKLLPLLSRALEFGGAPASAVGSLMLISRSLEGDEFVRRVVPSLSRLFTSSDRNLRRNLLESIDTYGQHLTTDVVENQIYPPLSSGFTDENAYIRELTLKSILTLAPKMKQSTLTQNLLKHLSRLQVDNESSIRANTTVLLGNIAPYLGDVYCKKVLLNAFGRALKDSFPPARVAALRALAATLKYYSPEEVACRALPAITPLCVDGLPDVRSAALACVEAFAKLLKDNDAKLVKEAAAAAAAAGAAAPAGGGGGITGGTGSSMLGWAMSSLAASSAAWVGGSSGSSATSAARPAGGAAAAAAAGGPPPPVAAAAAAAAAPSRQAVGSAAGLPRQQPAVQLGGAGKDGWDEDFDDEDDIMDKEEQEARNRLAGLSTRSHGNSSAASSAAAARTSTSSGGGSGGGGSSSSAASKAAAAGGGGSGWDNLDGAGAGWDALDVGLGTGTGEGKISGISDVAATAAARPRPVKPAGTTGAAPGSTLGAKPAHKGAMKLGASKLGATKLQLD